MQQTLPTSASPSGAHSYEDDILSDVERLFDERPQAQRAEPVEVRPRRFRLVAPLVLLAGVGAALALMPAGVKDVLITGRSAAHSPDR